MQELETRLKAWPRRRPASALEARIFRARPESPPLSRLVFSLLAPATAAVMLVCGMFNQRNCTTIAISSHSGPWVAMVLSNQSAASFVPGTFQKEANSLPADTFGWTNDQVSTLTIPSLSGSRGKND
jgi:hypothetical protein